MPESEPTCSHEGCPRPVYRNPRYTATDKCIFHAKGKDPQAFRDALAKQIRKWRREKADEWDFREWVFVDVERQKKYSWQRFNLFRRAVFPFYADFSGATFSGDVNYRLARFLGSAYFFSAQFSGDAHFSGAQFSGDAYFSGAHFSGNVGFHNVQFSEDANLFGAQFSWIADFGGAVFIRGLDLTYVSFAVLGDFNECRIAGQVRLSWPGEGKKQITLPQEEGEKEKGIPPETRVIERGKLRLRKLQFVGRNAILDLRRNNMAEDVLLRIEECDMRRILLEGTDCTKIQFYNNNWPTIQGRKTVGDEFVPRRLRKRRWFLLLRFQLRLWRKKKLALRKRLRLQRPDWHLISTTYQQLARRFREDFNHTAANDFDRGTFEMRRLSAPNQSWIGQRLWKFITNDFPEKSKWYTRRERFGKTWAGRAVLSILKTVMLGLKRYCSLVAVYRYVTLYGGSILLPAVWTLTMTAGFAGLYELTAYGGVLPAASWSWPTHGTIAALRVIALNRAWLATEIADKPYELQVTAIASLQVILTAVLVTMLIFAVRRRFKHG